MLASNGSISDGDSNFNDDADAGSWQSCYGGDNDGGSGGDGGGLISGRRWRYRDGTGGDCSNDSRDDGRGSDHGGNDCSS